MKKRLTLRNSRKTYYVGYHRCLVGNDERMMRSVGRYCCSCCYCTRQLTAPVRSCMACVTEQRTNSSCSVHTHYGERSRLARASTVRYVSAARLSWTHTTLRWRWRHVVMASPCLSPNW